MSREVFRSRLAAGIFACAIFSAIVSGSAWGQAVPQKNVNAIGPTPLFWLYTGNPRMQQNEPECAVSPTNPEWLACGYNDYRGVNDPAIGDAFPGISMSRDLGQTWISGLHPWHLGDLPSLGKKFGADANLEALPGFLMYNFIAGWRDDSQPGGVYISRWYEHNREVGPPWEFLDTVQIDIGTAGRFLDKPAFHAALRNPDDGRPDISIAIPAYTDPRNVANSHAAYTLKVPAARAFICYSVFVGNDNNDGTKINCLASDDGGATWPVKTKLTESIDINQGVSIASRNYGQEVLAVWRRFSDNNETSAIMYSYSTDAGSTWGKAEVLTEFCAFDQGTGPARFRTNALPVAVSDGDGFGVYFASRNNARETCVVPAKGNTPATPRMSPVALEDDFDSFGETTAADGSRIRDGRVRTSLNFSRIMMVRSNSGGRLNWGQPVMLDPQESATGVRRRGHQFMPAAESAGGIETVSWYDTRLDKLNNLPTPLAGGFVEDLVLHLEPEGGVGPGVESVALLPSGIYEQTPPPPQLPPAGNNIPLRRTIDVFAAQVVGGGVRPYVVDPADWYPTIASDPNATSSPSTRVSRYATRQKPNAAPGVREQVEWDYPNGRLFRKGKAPFIGDYNSVFAVQARQRQDGAWVPNQTAPVPGIDLFGSQEPVFHVGWTSNRNVRGRVFYTGCDTWDETLQMWVSSPGCESTYTDPNPALMLPLQGEDGALDGPPLSCSAVAPGGRTGPLTRNQNIYVAAMKPGISANVLSAIKPSVGGINTFVLGLQNGSQADRLVRLSLPAGAVTSFDTDGPDTLLSVDVLVPKGSGNARTVFDFGNSASDPGLPDQVVVTVSDANTGQVLAQVPLKRSTLETPPLENVQNNDPDNLVNLVGDFEFYQLILKREIGTTQSLDLENLDLENTVYMLDLENLDLENLDLENLDLENLDLENVVLFLDLENLDLENLDLENALYEQLDLENLDLENLDLENLDLENLDLENRNLFFLDLENLDLENLDLENLDLENLDLENLDLDNLDLENLDLENFTVYASDIENLDLENLDLENTAVGADYTEISWTADSATNTTTGVDVKPIFSPTLQTSLAEAGTTVVLTVRQGYMTSTVQNNEAFAAPGLYCTPQVVVENQLIYAAVLGPDEINNLIADPDPTVPGTPSFVIEPDASKIITLRFINPPAGMDIVELSANTGMAIYAQPGGTFNCDAELGGAEVHDLCEIDYIAPDSTAPVLTIGGDNPAIVEASPLGYSDAGATAQDDKDGDITASILVTSTVDASTPGLYSVDYEVRDAAGNVSTAARSVVVVDTTPPALTAPAGVTVEATGAQTTVAIGIATATDFVGPVTTTNDAPASFPVGDTVVTWTASDGQVPPNTSSATQTVTVTDTTAPEINAATLPPATIVVEANDAGGWVYSVPLSPLWDMITATDLVDGVIAATCVPDATDSFPFGPSSVSCTATDAAGNVSAAAGFVVDVQDNTGPTIDGLEPPTFDRAEPFVVAFDENTFTLRWGPVTATDVDPNLDISCSVGVLDPAQPLYTFVHDFPVGTTTVTCTATDSAGNTSSGTFSVTVLDQTGPIVTLAGADPQLLEAGVDPYVELGAAATDVVSGDVSGSLVIDASAVNTAIPGSYAVTYTATDGSGNTSTVTRTVIVQDTTPPTLIPPADIMAEATGFTTPVALGAPTASDAVGVVSIGNTAPPAFPVGVTAVTWSAADAAGNLAAAIQVVTITDTTAPVITLNGAATLTLQAGVDSYVEQGATAVDLVDGNLTAAILIAGSVDTLAVGSYAITYDVTDAAGNAASRVTRTVNVVDTRPPTITFAENPLVRTTLGTHETIDYLANVSATDILDGTLSASCTVDGSTVPNPYAFPADSTSTVNCTATDNQGNTATGSFVVNVNFAYTFTLVQPKGNIQRGSVLPIDWYYTLPGTTSRVDSSAFMVRADWFGPFSGRNCSGVNTGVGNGSAAIDAGSSDFRYSASQATWQFSWQTPPMAGSYELRISPPGSARSTTCVTLK